VDSPPCSWPYDVRAHKSPPNANGYWIQELYASAQAIVDTWCDGKEGKKAKELLKRATHQDAGQVIIFGDENMILVGNTIDRCNLRHLSHLPVSGMDTCIHISPFLKAKATVRVLDVVGIDGRKFLILLVAAKQKANAFIYQCLLYHHELPCLLRTYPARKYIFQLDGFMPTQQS